MRPLPVLLAGVLAAFSAHAGTPFLADLERQEAEAFVTVGPEGRFWGSIRPLDAATVRVRVGRLGELAPILKADVETRLLEGPPVTSVSADLPSLEIVATGSELPLVVVLSNGLAQILGAGEPVVKAILHPRHEPTSLAYRPETGRLWVGWEGGFEGFELPPGLTTTRQVLHLLPSEQVEGVTEPPA